MRGKVADELAAISYAGITPAHAGKSLGWGLTVALSGDHPRACGEKFNPLAVTTLRRGSPPRMRGKA